MKKIELTPYELRQLKAAKKQLLTDVNATPSANQRSEKIIAEVAKKHNVDSQIIYNLIP